MERDYSLVGKAASLTKDSGIANPTWFRPAINPEDIQRLREKSDAIALRDTVVWLGSMVVSAGIAMTLWPSWWSVPFWFVYGVLYGSASDSRWRASHVRHHTDTIIVGRDPEIVAMRPPDLMKIALNLFGIIDAIHLMKRMLLHASGRLHPEEATYLRKPDYCGVYRIARIWLLVYAGVIVLALWLGSWLPLMVIGLPRLYGAWHHVMTGLLQHLGLAENVTDHRLNTRTVLMNPISRFIYLNMNYHIEHHMFTMVPYYNLPKLHKLIKQDLPTPEPSIYSAFRRLLPVLMHQLRYKDAVIIPQLPAGATPYRNEVEQLRPHAV